MNAETQEPKRRGRPREIVPAEVEAAPLICRVLSIKQFAACIGVSADAVRDMIAAGKVRYIDNPSGGKRIPREEVDAYLRRYLKESPSKAAEPARPVARGRGPSDLQPAASDGKIRTKLRG